MDAINLHQKLGTFSDTWTPKIVANINNFQVYVAKLEGDFIWHQHDEQDEFFQVIEGRLRIDFRDKQVWLEAGEILVVPKGVEHKPYAPDGCSVLIIENGDTDHTGGIHDPRRKDNHERI